MRNNLGSRGNAVKRYFLSGALAALLITDRNHLCNFGRGYYEEQLCEIILNLGHWFRRIHFSRFLICSCGSLPVR